MRNIRLLLRYSWGLSSSGTLRGVGRQLFNPLKRNDPYNGRTAPLTSKRYILYIFFNKHRY